MPLDGLASVQLLSHDGQGQEISNTFFVSDETASAEPSLAELTGIAADFAALAVTPYKALLHTSNTFDLIKVSQVADPTVTPPEVVMAAVHGVGGAGTRTTSTLPVTPKEMTGLLKLTTPNASRRFRGHLFLPAFLDSQAFANDSLDQSSVWWTAANAFRLVLDSGRVDATPRWSGATISKYSLVCFSRAAAKLGQASVANVSQTSLSTKVRWLRSRNKGTV
jgi:hypothetical protein